MYKHIFVNSINSQNIELSYECMRYITFRKSVKFSILVQLQYKNKSVTKEMQTHIQENSCNTPVH